MASKYKQGDLNITLYEVRLVCAVPDYGVGSATAIDYILEGAIDEINVLESEETTLRVVRNNEASQTVPAKHDETTLGDDEDSLVQALAVDGFAIKAKAKTKTKAKAKTGKHKKAYKPRSNDVLMRIEKVYALLQAVETASANELAALAGEPVKQVYNALYSLHDAKKIGADKQHGLVRWFANK
tara:strand:- start:4190 stop:4741 length:552 start_codon:yes stop_codon:yes gene_type:complete